MQDPKFRDTYNDVGFGSVIFLGKKNGCLLVGACPDDASNWHALDWRELSFLGQFRF